MTNINSAGIIGGGGGGGISPSPGSSYFLSGLKKTIKYQPNFLSHFFKQFSANIAYLSPPPLTDFFIIQTTEHKYMIQLFSITGNTNVQTLLANGAKDINESYASSLSQSR